MSFKYYVYSFEGIQAMATDKNRKFGAHRTTVGEFDFAGRWDGEALLSSPAQYRIVFNEAVAGVKWISVHAEDLGYKPKEGQEESLKAEIDFMMNQFGDAVVEGRAQVVEYDAPPMNKEERFRSGSLVSISTPKP